MYKQEMERANITSSKVTHAGRGSGARHAQEMGAGIEEIAQHGHWNNNRVVLFYLSGVPKDVPHKLAGFSNPTERSWLPRNTLIPPLELQQRLWPFIEKMFPGGEDGRMWLENVMMDRDEVEKRPSPGRFKYDSADFYKMRLLILLAHLRKVVLQDAVALMEKNEDPNCIYSHHYIFEDRVFRDPLFARFKIDMKQCMETASPPITDSLRANAPGIHNELRGLSDQMASMKFHVHDELKEFRKGLECLFQVQGQQYQEERDSRNAHEIAFIGAMRDAAGDWDKRLSGLQTMYASQHERKLDQQRHRSQQDQLNLRLQKLHWPQQQQQLLPQRQQQQQQQQPQPQQKLLAQAEEGDQGDGEEEEGGSRRRGMMRVSTRSNRDQIQSLSLLRFSRLYRLSRHSTHSTKRPPFKSWLVSLLIHETNLITPIT